MIKEIIFSHSLTNSHSANSIPFIYLPFIDLQVKPTDVKIVKYDDTMILIDLIDFYSCSFNLQQAP